MWWHLQRGFGAYGGLQGFIVLHRALLGFIGLYFIGLYRALEGFRGLYMVCKAYRRCRAYGLYRALSGFMGLHRACRVYRAEKVCRVCGVYRV